MGSRKGVFCVSGSSPALEVILGGGEGFILRKASSWPRRGGGHAYLMLVGAL